MTFSASSLCYSHFQLRVREGVIFLFTLHWLRGRFQPWAPSHALAPFKAPERGLLLYLHHQVDFVKFEKDILLVVS